MKIPFIKLRRHPPKVADQYFATFEASDVDPEDERFAEIIADSGDFSTTFPQISLADLNDFLNRLQTLAIDENISEINLGDISYLRIDPDTNNMIETGLTWDNATITMNSENFVVETLRSVFNDKNTRVDDNVTFADLNNASIMFIQAALQYVQAFREGDMPDLPTESEYDSALNKNEDLVIRPSKLRKQFNHTETTTDDVTPTSESDNETLASEATKSQATEANAESAASPDTSHAVTVPSSASNAFYSNSSNDTDKTEAIGRKLLGSTANAQEPKPDGKQVARKSHLNAYTLLNSLSIKSPLFTIDDALPESSDLSDANYVNVTLNNEAKEANAFLSQTKQTFTFSIQSQVLAQLAEIEKNRDLEIEKLKSNDPSEEISSNVRTAINTKYANILKQNQEVAQREYDQAVENENNRHTKALADLEASFVKTKDALQNSNTKSRDAEYLSEFDNALNKAMQEITHQVESLTASFDAKADKQVMTKIESLAAQASDNLGKLYNRFKAQLEKRRNELVDEKQKYANTLAEQQKAQLEGKHIDELEQKNDQLHQQIKHTNRQKVEEISAKDQQISQLEKENTDLQKQVDNASNAIDNLKSASNTAATLLDSIPEKMLPEKPSDNVAELLEKILSQQSTPQPKQKNAWKTAFIAMASVFGLGVVGSGGYFAVNQIEASHQADLKKLSDKDAAERADLKKQVVSLQKKVDANKSTNNASSVVTAQPTNTATSVEQKSSVDSSSAVNQATSSSTNNNSQVQSSTVQQTQPLNK